MRVNSTSVATHLGVAVVSAVTVAGITWKICNRSSAPTSTICPEEASTKAPSPSVPDESNSKASGANKQLSGKWLSEVSTLWPGQAFSLEYDEVLFDEHSDFQHVQVFKTKNYGNCLVLDGVIQVTEKDECAYQEMMVHPAMVEASCPVKRVLVIGGGDGGVAREILKHPSVEEVIVCEIDMKVIEASKKFLPKLACSYSDPRVHLVCRDGAAYLRDSTAKFDVVITDSSDPVGPAASLFEETFTGLIGSKLSEGGVAVSQGECMWLHSDIIAKYMREAEKHFQDVSYRWMSLPSYPCGTIGTVIMRNYKLTETEILSQAESAFSSLEGSLNYYNPKIHIASTVLPNFVRKFLTH